MRRRRRGSFRSHRDKVQHRFTVEPLEDRSMLSVTLGPITGPDANGVFNIPSGKDLYVPLLGSDTAGTFITYTVSSNNSNVKATVLTGNPTLEIDVSGMTAGGQSFSGSMTFQLFENIAPQTVQAIINDVNAGLYTGASFYRAETSTGFKLIQGGVAQTPGKTFPPNVQDELNVAASFNSGGLLAMANSGQPNSGSSDFFITAPNVPLANEPQASLNFGYTIFGQILTGQDIYNDILNTPTQLSGGLNIATNPVTITGASIITDNQHNVLQISEPSTFTGNATITVTANATDGTHASQSFSITAAHPSVTTVPLFLNPISNLTTTNGTAVSFQLTATVDSRIASNQYTFSVTGTNPFTGAPVNVNAVITSVSGNTANVTLTPSAGANNSFVNLVAHIDDTTHNLHDALPFTLTVGTVVSVTSVTSPIDVANVAATTISGTGEVGATISVVASDGTHSTVAKTTTVNPDGTWTVNAVNVSSLNDGTVTYTATVSDSGGNSATATKTATKDTLAPAVAVTTVTNPIVTGNGANTTASGTAEVGATISVVATDGVHTTTAKTTTVGSGGHWTISGIDLSTFNEGTITFTATATDTAGNSATASKAANKDTVPPAVSVTSTTSPIGSPTVTNTTVSGTGEIGATISVVVTDGTHTTAAKTTTVGSGATWTITGINVSSLNDGTVTYTATATDAAGNSATSTKTSVKDILAPAVSISTVTSPINAGNATGTTISGTGEVGATISVVVNNGATHTIATLTTTVVSGGTWSISNVNVSSLNDGTLTYTATATDAAGNTATATKTAVKDTVLPAVAISTVTSAITATNDTNTKVTGTGTVGATITVTVTDGTHTTAAQTTTVNQNGKWSISGIDVSGLSDGTITFSATAADAVNNTAADTQTADKNTAGSTVESTTTTVTSNHSSGSTYGQSVTFTATVHGTQGGTPTGSVQFKVDGVNSGAAQTLTGGSASLSLSSLSAGNHTITAVYTSNSSSFSSSQDDVAQAVAKASLTITANNQSKIFGAILPTLTAGYSGFVNSDTSASLTTQPTLTTTATATSAVGNYSITASGATSSNYTIHFVAGSLSITKSQTVIVVVPDSSTIDPTQGDTLTATVTPVAPGSGAPTGTVTFKDGSTVLGTGSVGSGGTATLNIAAGALAVGGHNITAVYAGSANFAASPTSAATSITVSSGTGGSQNPDAPTVTIGGATKGVRGQILNFTFNATDSNTADVAAGFGFSINWGDGHTQTVAAASNNGTQTLQHTYTTNRSFHIQATATDHESNISTAATQNVAIAAIAVQSDSVNPAKKDLFIGGTMGGDSIFVMPWSGNRLGVLMNGHFMGSFAASSVYVMGQAGNDMVMVMPSVHVATVLDGGSGNDRLQGGSGRNLLIGGRGSDMLMGGRADDIFVPGSSTFEGNAGALNSVMAAWNSNQSFATRKTNLNGTGSGTGPNGQTFLTTGATNPTVLSDGAVDHFFGHDGHDWFLPG